MHSCPHSTPHEMWMRRTMLTAVLEFCWQQHSTRKNVGEGGRGRRAKKKACLVTGRMLKPDQNKTPLHAARRKNPCSVDGCTAKAKASLLCKTKTKKDTGKWQEVRCKKHSQKGSARCSRFAARLWSRANVHACTDHGAHGIYSAWRCKIIAAHGNKKRFLSRVPKKTKRPAPAPGCSNVLQARGVCCNTHTMHGFCAIDGCVTGAGKDGLCTKHAAFGLCTLNTCSTAADRRRIVQQAWRWQHSSVQP